MIDHYKKIQNLRDNLYDLYPEFETNLNENHITDVLIIWASSRSGSSVLFDTLSEHSKIISPQGEDSTFYRLYNYHHIHDQHSSDANFSLNLNTYQITKNILRDSGTIDRSPSLKKMNFFKIQRNLLQSPEINWDQNNLCQIINGNTEYSILNGQINETIIEEPPFIFPKYKKQIINQRNILLLKSSSNLHRPDYIFKLFPHARFHHIYLRRRPEQSINGLIDGWHSPAFHSHYLPENLEISDAEYSDKKYWKFDLPSNWKNFINKSIPEICAFQWKEANIQLLELHKKYGGLIIDYDNLFEIDILFKKINSLLISLELSPLPLKKLNLVMNTETPDLNRWKNKESIISPLIKEQFLSEIYEEYLSR